MSRRRNGAGLFNGYWLNMDGTKQRRIFRSEYGELYRLHRLCLEVEASVSSPWRGERRWLPLEGGYAEISFPGIPRFVERWQEEATKAPNPCAAAPLPCEPQMQTPLPASASEAA